MRPVKNFAAIIRMTSIYVICAVIASCGTRRVENTSSEVGKAFENDVVAIYRGGQILQNDLPRDALYNEEFRLYKRKLNRIRKAIAEKYFEHRAKKENISIARFKEKHIFSRISVTESEIEARYARAIHLLQDRYRYRFAKLSQKEQEAKMREYFKIGPDPNKSFEMQAKELFRQRIVASKEQDVIRDFLRNAGLKIYLPSPVSPHYDIETERYPAIGSSTAPITLVAFGDFQCLYSKQAAPALKKLIETFPGKVHLVFRSFPLERHPNAQMAAEAAACAGEQGKFWEYHDLLFANQENLSVEDLETYARQLCLDIKKFKESLHSRKYEEDVKANVEQGFGYGVVETPAFYINGKPYRQTTTDFFEELHAPIQALLKNEKPVQPPQGILAEVGGVVITEDDLPKGSDYELEEDIYQVRWNVAQKYLEQKLVTMAASERGMSVDSFYEEEIDTAPTSKELEDQYEIFQSYVTGNPRLMFMDENAREAEVLRLLKVVPDAAKSFEEQVKQKLTALLEERKLEQGKPLLMARLMNQYNGKIHLEAPEPPMYEIATEGYPSIGPDDAPTTIVVFSDFQCPYCERVTPTLNQVLARYAGNVRLVFRNFPLSRHKEAQKAHEAAACAQDQGKFWEYHDLLFAHQNALDVESLKQYADEAHLDVGQFNKCLDSGKYAELVKLDVKEAAKYGVSGTPSFYINGIPRRIRSFEQFAWYITGGKEGAPTSSGIAALSGAG